MPSSCVLGLGDPDSPTRLPHFADTPLALQARWASVATTAHARSSAGSSTARRNTQPVAGLPSSHRYQRSSSSARPSSAGVAGASPGSARPANAASAHQDACRPAAMPLRRPFAPPLAAVQAIQASASAPLIGEIRTFLAPSAAIACIASPSMATAWARPFDPRTHACARSTSASTTSGSRTISA